VEAWTKVQLAERLRKDADSLIRANDRTSGARVLAQADSILALTEVADASWPEAPIDRGWVALRRAQLEKGLDGLPFVDAGSRHAERALQRASNNPEALALRGTLTFRRYQIKASPDPATLDSLLQSARRDLESAVAADPSLARTNITLSYLYYAVKDVPGALLAARRAYEEDAYLEEADRTLDRLFWGSLDLEQFAEARRWCAEGARRFPRDSRFVQCQLWLMVTPAVPAAPEQAWRLVALLDTVTPTATRPLAHAQGRILAAGALARAAVALGRADLKDSARNVLRTTRESITNEIDPQQSLLSQEAYIRTLTGDNDIAIDLLKQYVAANPDHPFAQRANSVWWWRDLRSHPRWREVAQPAR
jgi:tetratricopeptide (TPR) repeat protein